ncbi:HNH endonuclease [Hoyosella sp. YIM 151337]|uniref:HNH endonuclease signature motif containing protein n=1 Tax=Hoyosella sp. YIM 151337 TaxID=2992742 RepID=UPI002236BF4B|nr:HNH endonuclease signature motif containing protein [Hoyosella sp. YIM 151337]MCW4352146.1 HNH endonuclease [Hoyosella sp. YIM 151337]
MLGGDEGPELYQLTDAELIAVLTDAENVARAAAARQCAVIAEITARGVSSCYGYRDVPGLLQDVLRVDRGMARRWTRRASVTCAGSGAPTVLPVAAAAFDDGDISAAHLDAIDDALAGLPPHIKSDQRAEHETTLTELARAAHPGAVRAAGRYLIALAEQDTPPRDEELAAPRRELTLEWNAARSTLRVRGTFDKESGVRLETLLSPLAAPRPATEGSPDVRSRPQRYGDALAELLDHTERAAALPADGGEPPHIVVTMTLEQLTGELDAAALVNHDSPIPAGLARRLACDAKIIPAVLGARSEILDLGRAERTSPPGLRRALNLRDKGCVFPGCTRPHRWCHAHHLKYWSRGGATSLANMALLCTYHHTLVHHSDWEIQMGADGIPEAVPPVWIDPTRTPRRNHYHRKRHAG